jgi:hypothetical protein
MTFSFPLFVTTDAYAQANAQEAEEVTERAKEARAIYPGGVQEGRNSVMMCTAFFTVDYVEEDTDPHLPMGGRLLLVGPLPVSGNYQITPQSGIPWQFRHYVAELIAGETDLFALERVMVDPHDGGDRPHDYNMKITFDGDCPSYLYFTGLGHTGEPLPLDPGHAGASR